MRREKRVDGAWESAVPVFGCELDCLNCKVCESMFIYCIADCHGLIHAIGGKVPFEAAVQWTGLLKRACKTRHMRNTIKRTYPLYSSRHGGVAVVASVRVYQAAYSSLAFE